jgi:hypothetical protein
MAKVEQRHECDTIFLEVFLERIASIVRISVRLVVESEESPVHEDIFVFSDDTDQGLLQGNSEYGLRDFKKKTESVCITAQKKFNVKSRKPTDTAQKLLKCIYCLKVTRTDQFECEEIFVQVQPFSKDSSSGALDPSQTFAYKHDGQRSKLSSGDTDSFFPVDLSIIKHPRNNNCFVDSAFFTKFTEHVHDFQKAESLHFSNGREIFELFFKDHPIPVLYQLQQNIEQLRQKQEALRRDIYSYGVSEWFEYCFQSAIRRKIIFDAAETKVDRFVMPNGPLFVICRTERLETKEHCLLARYVTDDVQLQVDDFVSFEQSNKRYYFRVKNRSEERKSLTEIEVTVLLEHVELNFDVPLESVKCIQSSQSVQLVRHPILHFMVKFKKDNAFMGKNLRKFKNNAFLKKVLEWEINDSRKDRLPASDLLGYSITRFTDTELAITALFLTATGDGTDKSFDGAAPPSSFQTLRKFSFQKLDMG